MPTIEFLHELKCLRERLDARIEGLEDSWISVVDAMPSEAIDILCCNSCDYAPVSARHSTLFFDSHNKQWRSIGTGDIVHFTHWKALDAPPVTFK